MYYPESYFDIEILKEVLEQYSWPSDYYLQEVKSGNIIIVFPKCRLIISEGFESSMTAYFLNSEINRTETQASVSIFSAVQIVKSRIIKNAGVEEPEGLVRFLEVEPSLEKVKHGLNNICILLQAYLLPCIEGDFSWVEEYNRKHPY
nr:hypothetical protein [uncultured Arsenicibacter sp.]